MAHQRSSVANLELLKVEGSFCLFRTPELTAMQRDLLKSRLARLDPAQLPSGGEWPTETADDDSLEALQVAGNDEEEEDEERDSFPADLGQLKK